MPFIGNKPSAVPLTSADIADGIITSAKIVDATIANADIANSTINLTTKVTGTLPVANGGTGLAALGTAAQELRVNGGATALEYYTPTVASSDYVLLDTTDISSSTASVSFDGYFSSTYTSYKLLILYADAVCTSNSCATGSLRFRRSNADITGSNYTTSRYATMVYDAAGASQSFTYSYDSSSIPMVSSHAFKGGGSYKYSNEVTLFNPSNTTSFKSGFFTMAGESHDLSGGRGFASGEFVCNDSTSALSGVTFFFSGSNIASGKFKLYGIK